MGRLENERFYTCLYFFFAFHLCCVILVACNRGSRFSFSLRSMNYNNSIDTAPPLSLLHSWSDFSIANTRNKEQMNFKPEVLVCVFFWFTPVKRGKDTAYNPMEQTESVSLENARCH
jgi:hypothetical protein